MQSELGKRREEKRRGREGEEKGEEKEEKEERQTLIRSLSDEK